eukprot:2341154-Ditylum_brightwellii.AAC.1
MAMYALHLIEGGNLVCRAIKANTIYLYLSAACQLSEQKGLMKPTIDNLSQKSHWITSIINEHKCWENMPNRQEPLTNDMINYIINQAGGKHKDSLEAAMRD